MKKILLTGAAGTLGSVLRPHLDSIATTRRLSDIVDIANVGPDEEVMKCYLGDLAAVQAAVEGCDGIIHLGGIPIEDTFDNILDANVVGTYNIYEAARREGVQRIFLASSNHAIGYHRTDTTLDADSSFKPDSLYGASKVWGEAIADLYFNKFGIESAKVRIGTFLPEPSTTRSLKTWFSHGDFMRLVQRVFIAPELGCPVIYGVSDNTGAWWENSDIGHLGWVAQDNADAFRDNFPDADLPPDMNDPAQKYQGGTFAAAGHFEDGESKSDKESENKTC
jgi:uronate dehydrogenase